MTIVPFQREDIPGFLHLAGCEGWIADAWEFDFLLDVFPAGCFTARDEAGEARGYVTSLRHEQSGWIGNLIVAEGQRGRGVGAALFRAALDALTEAGVATCWLTASPSGKALYERHGFKAIDTIIRWCGVGRQRCGSRLPPEVAGVPVLPFSGIDLMTWGDRRTCLLQAVTERGTMLREDNGFLVVQSGGADRQVGPFASLDSGCAARLFDEALAVIPRGEKYFIDVPLSNRDAARMLHRRGAREAGSAELMYAGVRPAYRGEFLYGLATMGSCG